MDNKYLDKILKQLNIIKVSLILSILTFVLVDTNKLLAVILFSILISICIYRLIIIKSYVQEICMLNKKETQSKEKTLIDCYEYIKEPIKERVKEPVVKKNIVLKKNNFNQVITQKFNYIMDEEEDT